MNKLRLIFTATLFLMTFSVFGQTEAEVNAFIKKAKRNEIFNQMNEFMINRNYGPAIMIIDHFIKTEGENGNWNYRKGYCLLYSKAHDNKTSLSYLRKAAENVNPKYNAISPDEKGANEDVTLHLAKSEFINENLSKAEKLYTGFIEGKKDKDPNKIFAQWELAQVKNAKKLMDKPKNLTIDNLGRQINSKYPEYAPVITLDGQALYFTSRRLWADSSNEGMLDPLTNQYLEDIYVSYMDFERDWTKPVKLDFCLPDRHEATVSVAHDESEIYVYQDDKGDGNIYYSKFNGETFDDIQKIENKINSSAWETHLTFTHDGKQAYFVSDREGGLGGRDIWRMAKLPNGEWSEPLNLGTPVNSIYDEDAPFIGVDNKTLYYSSNGTNSMGGFDVFRTILNDEDEWSPPINMGYPLNTVMDDIFFTTTADGHTGFLSSNRADGHGEKDIYRVYDLEPEMIGIATLKGLISTTDGSPIPDDFRIEVSCKNCDYYPIKLVSPRKINGGYFTKLEPCRDFKVEFFSGDNMLKSEVIQTECNDEFQIFKRDYILDVEKMQFVDPKPPVDTVVEVPTFVFDGAELKHHFGYNKHKLDKNNKKLQEFVAKLATASTKGAEFTVEIESSASKVTTKTFGTNDKLAKKRASDIQALLESMLKDEKADLSKINIKISKTLVQGPAYSRGNGVDRSVYEKYQYIYLKAE